MKVPGWDKITRLIVLVGFQLFLPYALIFIFSFTLELGFNSFAIWKACFSSQRGQMTPSTLDGSQAHTPSRVCLRSATLKLTREHAKKVHCSQHTIRNSLRWLPLTFLTCSLVILRAILCRLTLKVVQASEPSKKLGANWPPCELELAFQTPNELKTLELVWKLKVKINAYGTKKTEPNQNDESGHFNSAKRLHIRGHLHDQLEHGWMYCVHKRNTCSSTPACLLNFTCHFNRAV